MQLIDGKATAAKIKEEIAEEVKQIVAAGGKRPHLAAILAKSFETALEEASEGIEAAFDDVSAINGFLRRELAARKAMILSPDDALPYVLNVSFEGFESETMLHCLEIYDIFVSTVSACSSKSKKVSYVLLESGVPQKIAANAVRISFSRYNTMAEAEE